MQEFDIEEEVRPGTVRLPVSRPGPAVSHALARAWSDEAERRLRDVGALGNESASDWLVASGSAASVAIRADTGAPAVIVATASGVATAYGGTTLMGSLVVLSSRPR